MTAHRERDDLRDWEAPGELLRRYIDAAGAQLTGYILCGAGVLMLTFAWWKISKESIVSLQIPYLVSGGLGGILALGLGSMLVLTHSLRLDNRRLEVLEETVRELRDALLIELDDPRPSYADPVPATVDEPRNGRSHGDLASRGAEGAMSEFVVVEGGSRYHRANCTAARNKVVSTVPADAAAELVPCRICEPTR